MIKILTFLLVCFLGLTATAHADGLGDRDWMVSSPHSLITYVPTDADVKTLVNKIADTEWEMPVCSYMFVDTAHDGNYRLIAALDASGRNSCNQIVVIQKNSDGFKKVNDWQVWHMNDVKAALQDLNYDHKSELILREAYSKYENNARCVATWQRIYTWKNGQYSDASANYLDYYKARRQQLEAELPRQEDSSCDQMEMDKIDRLLGSPKAGFDRSVAWMHDPKGSMRRKAAVVFADIGDDASIQDLKTLTDDDEPLTAETAKLYLDNRK